MIKFAVTAERLLIHCAVRPVVVEVEVEVELFAVRPLEHLPVRQVQPLAALRQVEPLAAVRQVPPFPKTSVQRQRQQERFLRAVVDY